MNFLDSLKTRTGLITPNSEMALVPQLVKHFLAASIEQRAGVLAKAANAPLESYHKIVFDEFSKQMENILNDEIRYIKEELQLDLMFPTFLEGQLHRVFFCGELTDADFASQKVSRGCCAGLAANLASRDGSAKTVAARGGESDSKPAIALRSESSFAGNQQALSTAGPKETGPA